MGEGRGAEGGARLAPTRALPRTTSTVPSSVAVPNIFKKICCIKPRPIKKHVTTRMFFQKAGDIIDFPAYDHP